MIRKRNLPGRNLADPLLPPATHRLKHPHTMQAGALEGTIRGAHTATRLEEVELRHCVI